MTKRVPDSALDTLIDWAREGEMKEWSPTIQSLAKEVKMLREKREAKKKPKEAA